MSRADTLKYKKQRAKIQGKIRVMSTQTPRCWPSEAHQKPLVPRKLGIKDGQQKGVVAVDEAIQAVV